MPRHEFTPKTRREALARAGDGDPDNARCEATGEVYGLDEAVRCNVPLKGKRPEFDHYPMPAGMPGSDKLANCVVCCTGHHGFKTAHYDVPMQAKDKRIRDIDQGLRKPSRWEKAPKRSAPSQHRATTPLKPKFEGEPPSQPTEGKCLMMQWVRDNYGVPAKTGGRVEYTGGPTPRFGTIVSANGSHINIRLDGNKHALPFHPTWELRYLDAEPQP